MSTGLYIGSWILRGNAFQDDIVLLNILKQQYGAYMIFFFSGRSLVAIVMKTCSQALSVL